MICYTSDVYTENKQNYLIYLSLYIMICYTSDVYTENKQNYLIYLSLYDLLYI